MKVALVDLGALIKRHRGPKSIRSAADELNLPPANLSRIENGQLPDLISFFKICRWLNISPQAFYEGEERDIVGLHSGIHLSGRIGNETSLALANLILAAAENLEDPSKAKPK